MKWNQNNKKILFYIISLMFASSIIYFLFRNQDPVALIEKILEVKFEWVILSMIFGAIAYINRGLRWIVLIDALGHESSKINSISAVSIGYLTNMLIPRAGEIARCTVLNRSEKIPIDKLFGTILIERVIDFIFLISLFLITLGIKFEIIIKFFTEIGSYPSETNSNLKYIIFFILLLLLILSFFIIRKKIQKTSFYQKILVFINGLKEGFKSIKKIKRKISFWAHTVSIWIMYFLMTYICFYAIPETSHLSVTDGLFLLVLGGIGMVIPTPGGLGSYHAIVMIGLSVLGVGGTIAMAKDLDGNPALIFPTIVHAAQTLVAIIMGSLGLLMVVFLKNKLSDE